MPLAGNYPRPPERLAAHLLLGTQVAAAGLLFPFLLRDARSAIQIVTAGLPFQIAVGYLAGRSVGQVAPAIAIVDAWLVTLALWSTCLKSPAAQSIGVACAGGLTLGAGVLAYLRAEFGVSPQSSTGPENASPLLTTLASLDHFPHSSGWFLLAGLALAAISVWGVRQYRRDRVARPSAAAEISGVEQPPFSGI